ncbi:gamma-tubulin complex component [Plakobranchus ocellatus]|uniref:Gamma-tubulin complex component 6 n=1 Tax=Plakobranchus ocellatus TaxID=259542 RepID=A0AAV3ZRK7_9GAST|nr:gamma-tubulin complex component [Plakobranchus ocellatus]
MAELSITECFNQLCETHLGPVYRAHRVQPAITRSDAVKRLKRKAYDALFSSLQNGAKYAESCSVWSSPEMEGVLMEVDRLRSQGRHADADRLEELLDNVTKRGKHDCLLFLVALKGCGKGEAKSVLGEGAFGSIKTAGSRSIAKKSACVSPVPPCYGERDITSSRTCFFMHYPREVFETLFAPVEKANEQDLNSVFTMMPGKGLGKGGFFAPKFLVDDWHENITHSSLFGGLVQGKADDINSFFQIPEISQCPGIRIPDFKTKKAMSLTQLSDESGVESGGASMSSSVMTLPEQPEHDPWFWVKALKAPRSYHYTWEWIGYAPEPTEKLYLTEAGPNVFDLLIHHRKRVLSVIFPSEASTLSALNTIHSETLVKHTLLMLTGVPSTSFLFNPVSMSFEICNGLHLSGTSPEMIADFLTEFIECGTFCRRLTKFSEAPVLNSFYTSGLVFQAFTVAIRKALSQFTAAILNTPTNLGLLQLQVYLHHAAEQIKYLAKLCDCYNGPPKPRANRGDGKLGQGQASFPTGMNLLSYLYNEADMAVNSSFYPLLLSILQTTCAPFVLFIRDWVFYGVLRDSYDEFMIKVDISTLINRDESYWNSAYHLDALVTVPHFLQGLVEDIVTCGKSINLLRVCSPQHFLCNLSEHKVPSVYITFSKEALQAMEQDCQIYIGRMRQISRQLVDDRAEMMKKAETAKAELQQTARKMADEEIARLQGIIDSRKKKAEDKKRKEFSRLKQQMEEDLSRRAGEKQAQKEEDTKLMARITREEDALTEEEIKLERLAREELVQYYTNLGEEATHRERQALWKIQRARLSMKRENFLERDAQLLAQELQQSRDKKISESEQGGGDMSVKTPTQKDLDEFGPSDDSPDFALSTSVDLPRWAQRHGSEDGNVTLEVSGEEEITLPAWAARELTTFADAEEELAGNTGPSNFESGIHLPSWVLRECGSDGDDSPRVIDDGSEKDAESDSEKDINEIQNSNSERDDVMEYVVSRDQKEDENNSAFKKPEDMNSLQRQLKAVQIGGSALPKPHIKTSLTSHHSIETEETATRYNTQLVQGRHTTNESSDPVIDKPKIKQVQGMSVNNQTEEAQVRANVRVSELMSATKESELEDSNLKSHVKFVQGVEVNQQTTQELETIPKRAKCESQTNVSAETVPKIWIIKKPSMFGHASQLSGSEYVLTAPKLKRHVSQHANMESEFKDFGIKPRIRMSKTMSSTKESHELDSVKNQVLASSKTQIKMVEGRGSNIESKRIDENEVARTKFLSRNYRGHASDSTIQNILYGNFSPSRWMSQLAEEDLTDGPAPRITLIPGLPYKANSFQSDFSCFDEDVKVDLMADVMVADLGHDLADLDVASEEDVEAYKYTPLSVLLARSVTAPIKAQISLVNSAIVNYFTSELRIDDHFVALRRYLLMADGDFSEILANILFEKLSTNPLPQEIFNPVFLNGALTKAVRSSIYSDDKHMLNLSFALNSMPTVLMPNAPNSLSCLELRYTVQWPLNVILTKNCMQKYCRIFGFLLQIKRVVWTLKDVWYRLKRDALVVQGAANSAQFRHLQLHRQEMEHFVKAMQGYITSQVIHVSWQEFQTKLAQPAEGLDQLRTRHQRYVDKAITKCLLDKKAAKVMKVIQDIFCLILKFRSQLVSASWKTGLREATHPNFEAIVKTHKSFHVYSFFLFKVVNRLSQKGYLPHLQELLLQLNFNDFYKEAAT